MIFFKAKLLARINFGPAFRSNTVAKLHNAWLYNGITTPIKANSLASVCYKNLLNTSSLIIFGYQSTIQ